MSLCKYKHTINYADISKINLNKANIEYFIDKF